MNEHAAKDGTSVEEILDALLYSVSHDLRSPLLSVSLSAELLELGGEGTDEAIRVLRAGAADLERMLQALTVLSRARRRELTVAPEPLGELLTGHVVISEVPELASVPVVVDARLVRGLLDTLGEGGPIQAQISLEDHAVRCDFAIRLDVPEFTGSPLAALVGSLQQFAGTAVEALATHELALARQGASVAREADRLVVLLPRAGE